MSKLRSRGLVSAFVAICMGFTPLAAANADSTAATQRPSLTKPSPTTTTPAEPAAKETQTYGVKGFLIKQALRVVSSMLGNGKVREIVKEARERGFIDGDMPRAI